MKVPRLLPDQSSKYCTALCSEILQVAVKSSESFSCCLDSHHITWRRCPWAGVKNDEPKPSVLFYKKKMQLLGVKHCLVLTPSQLYTQTLHSNFKRSTHPLKISIHLSPLFALLCRQSLATPSQQKSVLGNWWNFAISLSDRSKPQGSCRGRKQEVWELAEAWKKAWRWRIERERKSWARQWRKERKKWNEWWHQSHNTGP